MCGTAKQAGNNTEKSRPPPSPPTTQNQSKKGKKLKESKNRKTNLRDISHCSIRSKLVVLWVQLPPPRQYEIAPHGRATTTKRSIRACGLLPSHPDGEIVHPSYTLSWPTFLVAIWRERGTGIIGRREGGCSPPQIFTLTTNGKYKIRKCYDAYYFHREHLICEVLLMD